MIECGSTMGKYGNTCFFNSLQRQLACIGHHASSFHYCMFLDAGGFHASQRGKMIDTETHAAEINQLSKHLKIRIDVYRQNKATHGSFVDEHIPTLFGTEGPTILICKLYGVLHFNAFAWVGKPPPYMQTKERMQAIAIMESVNDMRAKEELKKSETIRCQLERDRLFTEKVQEQERLTVGAKKRLTMETSLEAEKKKAQAAWAAKQKRHEMELKQMAERHMAEIEIINKRQRLEFKQLAERHMTE